MLKPCVMKLEKIIVYNKNDIERQTEMVNDANGL